MAWSVGFRWMLLSVAGISVLICFGLGLCVVVCFWWAWWLLFAVVGCLCSGFLLIVLIGLHAFVCTTLRVLDC